MAMLLLILFLFLAALFVFMLFLPAIWKLKHPKDPGPRKFPDQTLYTSVDPLLEELDDLDEETVR